MSEKRPPWAQKMKFWSPKKRNFRPQHYAQLFFCKKKHLHIVWAKNFIFWAQGVLFSDLFVFSKFTESFQNLLSSLHQWEKLTTQPLHLYQIYPVSTESQ